MLTATYSHSGLRKSYSKTNAIAIFCIFPLFKRKTYTFCKWRKTNLTIFVLFFLETPFFPRNMPLLELCFFATHIDIVKFYSRSKLHVGFATDPDTPPKAKKMTSPEEKELLLDMLVNEVVNPVALVTNVVDDDPSPICA